MMDELTVYELQLLKVTLDLDTITSNGEAWAIVPSEQVEEFELRRCQMDAA